MASPVKLMQQLKDSVVTVEKWAKMTEEERKGHFRTGVLQDIEKTEFTEEYAKLIERMKPEE
jgi:hypothetical protein